MVWLPECNHWRGECSFSRDCVFNREDSWHLCYRGRASYLHLHLTLALCAAQQRADCQIYREDQLMLVFLNRLRRSRAGNAAIEAAIGLPVLISFGAALSEFGYAMWIQNTLQYAAESAARCAAINSTTCGTTAAGPPYPRRTCTG